MTDSHEGFNWTDTVEVPETGFELLPEGLAVFQITKLDRQRKEFGKFGVCNVAVVTFLCSPVAGEGSAEVQSQFALVKTLGWKIVKLATACGLRRSGDCSEIDPRWWGQFEGATGRCEIGRRTFTDKKNRERKVNDIVDFLPMDPEAEQSTPRGESAPPDEAGATGEFDNLPF